MLRHPLNPLESARCSGQVPSLHQGEQRLAFFDDVGGKLAAGDVAGIPRRMDRSGRNEQDVASPERYGRFVLELIFERAREHVDDLFARMGMLAEGYARGEEKRSGPPGLPVGSGL